MQKKTITFNPKIGKKPATSHHRSKPNILVPINTKMNTLSEPELFPSEKKHRELANAKSTLLQLHFIRHKLLRCFNMQEQSAVGALFERYTQLTNEIIQLYKTQTQNDEREIMNIGEESTQMQYDLLGDIAIGMDCIGVYLQEISKATDVVYNTMQIGKNVSFNSNKLAQSLIEFNKTFQINQPKILIAIQELRLKKEQNKVDFEKQKQSEEELLKISKQKEEASLKKIQEYDSLNAEIRASNDKIKGIAKMGILYSIRQGL